VRSVDSTGADVTANPDADLVRPVLECAAAILAAHIPDQDGWCRQCLLQWHRLVPGRLCTQAYWALQVIETHGVEGGTPRRSRRRAMMDLANYQRLAAFTDQRAHAEADPAGTATRPGGRGRHITASTASCCGTELPTNASVTTSADDLAICSGTLLWWRPAWVLNLDDVAAANLAKTQARWLSRANVTNGF
jgi:hypothetical protein